MNAQRLLFHLFVKAVTPLLVLGWLGVSTVFSQGREASPVLDDKVKAVFVFQFLQYVRWPEVKNEGPLRIAILGNSGVTPYLQDIAGRKQVGGRSIEIQLLSDLQETPGCHILFVGEGMGPTLRSGWKHVRGQPILPVGDRLHADMEFLGFGFFTEKERLQIEANLAILGRQDLKASSQLLKVTHLFGGGS